MVHKVEIPSTVHLTELFVLRGIKCTETGKCVIAEREYSVQPSLTHVVQFLQESGADFASIVTNFRIEKEDELQFM